MLDLFPVAKRAKDGRDTRCKACACTAAKAYAAANPERVKAYSKERYYKTRDECLARLKVWFQENPEKARINRTKWRNTNHEKARAQEKAYAINNREKVLQRKREYSATNPHMGAKWEAKRRAYKLKATPTWADESAIAEIYAECAAVSKATGIPHEVDHIVPLISDMVCGLHVEHNLRIIPRFDNRSKSNKLIEEIVYA